MIYLFYSSNIMGGAEYLIINCANILVGKGLEVGIIDYPNGWVVSNISNPLIQKRYIFQGEKIRLDEDDIIITTANNMYKLDNLFFESNAKVLFWTVQPYNVVLKLPYFLSTNKFFKVLGEMYLNKKIKYHKNNLELILNKNGIVSMDDECNKILKNTYNISYKNFLPIFIDFNKFRKGNYVCEDKDVINIVWLGRIDLEFKIYILKKLLLDLEKVNSKFKSKFVFNIIGCGPGLENLKNFTKENISFKVNFLYELKDSELDVVLEKSDIGFAMGTSALDISAKRVPTILVDFSYKDIFYYKYRWIFETNNYTLGRDIDFLSDSEIDSMKTLNSIFSELQENNKLLADLCFKYTYENHCSINVGSKLIKYAFNTELTLNDIYKYSSVKPIWSKFNHYLKRGRA
ncbi:hypothetical protein H0S56_00420 [Acinetobacter lwoffii]|uniref:hypothetical protein n=1 Tax=Acinetobacter lwoffii TaxID=28090 RepID=UPI0018A05E8E|nr:hypothetical protein [Acinetobacter lwoffii]QPF32216.1 hypothetical protein H0S56_00420 [Acinetobacter lwoffii]